MLLILALCVALFVEWRASGSWPGVHDETSDELQQRSGW